jgi:hypothetical protein
MFIALWLYDFVGFPLKIASSVPVGWATLGFSESRSAVASYRFSDAIGSLLHFLVGHYPVESANLPPEQLQCAPQYSLR